MCAHLSRCPVVRQLLCKACTVDLTGQILLEGSAADGEVVIGQVVIVVHQHTGIGVLFDGSTQGVAHRQFNVGVGRNQCAVIDNERLSGLVVNQPVQEVLGDLTLGIGGVFGGVNEEILGAAAKKLGYQVNNYARGLKTNKTYCVALVMPSLRHPFFAALTDELTSCLLRNGYRSLLMTTNYDSVAEKNCFQLAQQNKIDGIIALSYSPDLEVDESVPVVTIDRHFSAAIPCVSSDNYLGGELAAQKLMELGCRNLLFFRIGPDIHGEADKRGPGFESACRQAQIPYQSLLLRDEDTSAPFYQFLDDHIREGKLEFDGIFCNSDGLAVRICEFLVSRGIRIPEDVQVIGYDGILDFATGRYVCSTIVQPVADMAETAVHLLLHGDNTPANVSLPVQYARGGTTKA